MAAAALVCAAAFAADVTDDYGQSVPAELDAQVTNARKMRLPYHRDVYNPVKSIEILEEVVGKKPDYFRAWFNLGLAYWQGSSEGNVYYPKAKNAFESAIEIRDRDNIADVTVFNSAGWVSMSAGDYGAAEAFLQRGLEDIDQGSDFTKEAIYSNLGRVYFYTQRLDEAERYSRLAVEEFGNSNSAVQTLQLLDATKAVLNNQRKVLD